MTNSYKVFIDDNYNYMDEDSRYELGEFATYEEAVNACERIVDEFLLHQYKEGMTAEALYQSYVSFGEDPFIIGQPVPFRFSAWTYAQKRCLQICGVI